MTPRALRVVSLLSIAMACAVSGCTSNGVPAKVNATGAVGVPRPPTGVVVCGSAILRSPWNYSGKPGTFTAENEPKGLPTFGSAKSDFPAAKTIIVVPAGDNTSTATSGAYQVNYAVIYFEPGVHKIESAMYTGHNSAYVGGYDQTAGAAVLDGVDGATDGTGRGGARLAESSASSGNKVYDTWEYLTIKNYASSANNSVMGNVNNGDSDVGDTYKYDTIGPNEYGYRGGDSPPGRGENSGGGYAIDAGSNTTIEYNCLTHNAQGAFNLVNADSLNVNHNEISWNGLGEYPDVSGPGKSPYACGCSGGGKFFYSRNANFVDNYVHNNYNNGIWFDTDNAGASISGNFIAANWGEGIAYEAGYNANISGNTLVGNGWASDGAWPKGVGGGTCYQGGSCTNGMGPITGAGGGNPYAAIDLSDSGGNGNIKSRYAGQILVENNALLNNFGGVKVYTDTNRYPGNIDNDSACGIPLGVLNRPSSSIYYKQGKILVTNGDATTSGSAVTVSAGTMTICADYGQDVDSGPQSVVEVPSPGMAVYDQDSGAFLGTVASVASARAFTLSDSPGARSGASLLLSAYGGCGPADYYHGGLGTASGKPSARYWDNCLWGSRDVKVKGNVSSINAAAVSGCGTPANLCGYNESAAFNAGVPALMQFFDAYPKYTALASDGLGNIWSHNTYEWAGGGGWKFMAGTQGHTVSPAQWQHAPYNQDAGSVFK